MWKQVSDVAGLAKAAGADYVVVIPSMWRDDVTGEELEPGELDARLGAARSRGNERLGKRILEEYGMHVGVSPARRHHIDNNAAIERFLDNTDPRYVNLCLDTGHLTLLRRRQPGPDRQAPRPGHLHPPQAVRSAVIAEVDEKNLPGRPPSSWV